MAPTWQGSGPLRRGEERIAPGDEFEPTDAERRSFGDLIEDTDEAAAEESADEPETLAEPPFDPGDLSVSDLRERLDEGDYSDEELAALEASEKDGEDRKTAKEAITGIR